jgi:hypothetical protein
MSSVFSSNFVVSFYVVIFFIFPFFVFSENTGHTLIFKQVEYNEHDFVNNFAPFYGHSKGVDSKKVCRIGYPKKNEDKEFLE